MIGLSTGAAIDAIIILTAAGFGLWRGYRRRRAYWTASSWTSFGLTLLVGFALTGWSLYFSAIVGNRPGWIGPPGSTTRAAWALATVVSLCGGSLISIFSIGWFAQGKPKRPFPLLGGINRTSLRAVVADQPFSLAQGLDDDEDDWDDEVFVEPRR